MALRGKIKIPIMPMRGSGRGRGGLGGRYCGGMSEVPNPLPRRDAAALLGLVVVLQGELLAGEVSPRFAARLTYRLASTGLLPENASVGELCAVLDDMNQRLRYVLGEYDTPPEPAPRTTVYTLVVPTSVEASACQSELSAWGGSNIEMASTEGGLWRVSAAFADLPPNPSYNARVAKIDGLARQHGGRYEGAQR
jgi:hypothetical protein